MTTQLITMNKPDYQITREIRRPKNAVERTDEATGALIYLYTTSKNLPAAMAFSGKRSKADFCFYFRTDSDREDYIAMYLQRLIKRTGNKAAHKAAKDQHVNTLQTGDILVSTWGYDQTNVDFYQVVKATDKTVVTRLIGMESVPGSEGFMCNSVLPLKDNFTSDALAPRKVYAWAGNECIVIGTHTARKWEGKPVHQSWYA